MDEDDDEIVEEIPFYLSKGLAQHLYIFQYPLKESGEICEESKVVNSCVKPINQQVKIDFSLNTESENYDSFKGERLAVVADGKNTNKKERPTFRSGIMDKQSFVSTNPMEDVSKYVLCVLQDSEIHASPLKGILQMRPSFSYFDKMDNREKAEEKAESEADLDEEEKKVTVKFARNELDKTKKARERSFNFFSQKSADEPWCETLWYPKSSVRAELERQKIFSGGTQMTGQALVLTSKEYISSLIPPEKSEKYIETMLPANVISKAKLKALPLIDQIKILLKDAKVITFAHLISILADKTLTTEKVLRCLSTAGLMIRGNWVAQSEILYPPESVSGTNGVPADLMCRGRDYVLYKLSKNEFIDRRRVNHVTELPSEEVREILSSIGRLKPNKGWELILPPDTQFESKYPEVVQRQEMFWRAKEDIFNEIEREKSPKRVRKKSVREHKNSESKSSSTIP